MAGGASEEARGRLAAAAGKTASGAPAPAVSTAAGTGGEGPQMLLGSAWFWLSPCHRMTYRIVGAAGGSPLRCAAAATCPVVLVRALEP